MPPGQRGGNNNPTGKNNTCPEQNGESGVKMDRAHYRPEGELRPLQVEFIEWLLDPDKDKGSQAKWARDHGIGEKTPVAWKKDRKFRAEWEKRALELNVSIETTQSIIANMARLAASDDKNAVAAAKLYLEYVGKYTPTQKQVIEDRSVAKLSDDELKDELRRLLEDADH